jgi:hypothetical protein
MVKRLPLYKLKTLPERMVPIFSFNRGFRLRDYHANASVGNRANFYICLSTSVASRIKLGDSGRNVGIAKIQGGASGMLERFLIYKRKTSANQLLGLAHRCWG